MLVIVVAEGRNARVGRFGAMAPRVAMTLEQCWHRVPGGTAVAALGMARAVQERGGADLVGVAAAHRRPPAGWEPPVEVKHHPLPRRFLYESWHRLRWPSVESATGPIDAVHAISLAIPPPEPRLIVTIHDLAWRHDRSHFTPHGVRFFEKGFALTQAEANLVLCPSKATLEDCAEAGIERARLRLVPLGVDVERASEDEIRAVRAKHGLVNDYVLWTGTVEPRKNLARLLEAFAQVRPGIDLVLVGPKGWNENLEALVKPIQDRVKVLGFVPRSDLGPLYGGARVSCFPSLLEGFGFPVLEAMAQGTPVVTSRGTSTEELAGDEAVLIDPLDDASIASGIERVLEDDALAGELAAAGPARAAKYSWAKTADLLVRAYTEVKA
jgi:glycosyltransferase involved in cell wall biosynthesis